MTAVDGEGHAPQKQHCIVLTLHDRKAVSRVTHALQEQCLALSQHQLRVYRVLKPRGSSQRPTDAFYAAMDVTALLRLGVILGAGFVLGLMGSQALPV